MYESVPIPIIDIYLSSENGSFSNVIFELLQRLWQMRTTTVGGGLTSERGGGSDALGLASGTMNMSSLGTGSSLGGISSRGTRGSSIDRGRGRVRGGLYHSTLGGYQRSGFVYDDETRGIGGRVCGNRLDEIARIHIC